MSALGHGDAPFPHCGMRIVVPLKSIVSAAAGAAFIKGTWAACNAGAAPVTFSSVASSVKVTLLDNTGKIITTLTAGAPQKFGAREWVPFQSSGALAFPSGGWLSVELTDFAVTLQLAAPEVTTDAL